MWHDGEVTITADDAVNREPEREHKQTERDEAAAFLRQALAAGPRLAKDIREEAREVKGIASRTLDRAKQDAGVEAFRPENPGPWWWRLQDGEAQRHDPKRENGGALAFCPDDSAKADFEPDSEAQRQSANSLEAWRSAPAESAIDGGECEEVVI